MGRGWDSRSARAMMGREAGAGAGGTAGAGDGL